MAAILVHRGSLVAKGGQVVSDMLAALAIGAALDGPDHKVGLEVLAIPVALDGLVVLDITVASVLVTLVVLVIRVVPDIPEVLDGLEVLDIPEVLVGLVASVIQVALDGLVALGIQVADTQVVKRT